jgi:ubiquinone biosynthesis protein Coq4
MKGFFSDVVKDLSAVRHAFTSASCDFTEVFSMPAHLWALADSPIIGEPSPLAWPAFVIAKANPDTRRKMEERVRLAFTEEWLKELSTYPEGTLGRELSDHMSQHHLRPDFFPEVLGSDERSWWRQALRDEHNIWHIVSGYDRFETEEEMMLEELAFQVFQYAQTGSPFSLSLAIAGKLYLIRSKRHLFPQFVSRAIEAFIRGKRARSFLAYRWDRSLGTPLTVIRSELAVPRRVSL